MKGVFLADDGTGRAVMVATGEDMVKEFLGMSRPDWDQLVDRAGQEGGLLHLQAGIGKEYKS